MKVQVGQQVRFDGFGLKITEVRGDQVVIDWGFGLKKLVPRKELVPIESPNMDYQYVGGKSAPDMDDA